MLLQKLADKLHPQFEIQECKISHQVSHDKYLPNNQVSINFYQIIASSTIFSLLPSMNDKLWGKYFSRVGEAGKDEINSRSFTWCSLNTARHSPVAISQDLTDLSSDPDTACKSSSKNLVTWTQLGSTQKQADSFLLQTENLQWYLTFSTTKNMYSLYML